MAAMAQSLLVVSVLFVIGAQHAAAQNRGSRLPQIECYENTTLFARSLRIPTTMDGYIALIDRVERIPGLNMDMRTLSSTLVHRFRTDGVERDPSVATMVDGVVPFAPSGFQNGKHRLLVEKLIPGNALNFPNASLSNEERCGLHFMMSHSVDRWERQDETSTCSRLQQYRTISRVPRSVGAHDHHAHHAAAASKEEADDYPEIDEPVNEERAARQMQAPESQCPIEDGALWTKWGAVSGGALMAGIAAGLQRQDVSVNQMQLSGSMPGQDRPTVFAETGPVNNLYAATLSGDLAEVVLLQGPRLQTGLKVGALGGWNDTSVPRHYFLQSKDNYEMTDAEIRGALDGLILGMALPNLQSAFGSQLKLSQVLDMYYSERGIPTQRSYRACQRKEQFSTVAPTETIQAQVRNIIPALQNYLVSPFISDTTLENYITSAVNRLQAYIPGMNDKQCEIRDNQQPQITAERTATPNIDLYLVLDPTWMYEDALPTLAALLREITPHSQGSSLTMFIGSSNELPLLNYTRSILEFYGNFTYDTYQNYRGSSLEIARSLTQLRSTLAFQLDEAKRTNRAGGRSQNVLFIVNTASGATDENSRVFLRNEARIFRESNPDARLMFWTSGNKERFRDLVLDPERDLFLLAPSFGSQATPDVKQVVDRLSGLPQRFTNPSCGSRWSMEGNSGGGQQMTFYADTQGIAYYRLMPNYFMHTEVATVRFQGTGQGRLSVCFSRNVQQPIAGAGGTGSQSGVQCKNIQGSDTVEFRVEKPCSGKSYSVDCAPFYFSVVATDSSNRCQAQNSNDNGCRYPDLVRFSVTATGLDCHSGSAMLAISSLLIPALALLLSKLS